MQFVQPLLTFDQAVKLSALLNVVVPNHSEHNIEFADEAEETTYLQLAGLFQAVIDSPLKFRPAGKMAATVKSVVRTVKGPPQPKSAAPKRSQGQQKRDRKLRRELAAEYNAARERVEQELEEAKQVHMSELQSKQDKASSLLEKLYDAGYIEPTIALLELIGADGLAAQARTLG